MFDFFSSKKKKKAFIKAVKEIKRDGIYLDSSYNVSAPVASADVTTNVAELSSKAVEPKVSRVNVLDISELEQMKDTTAIKPATSNPYGLNKFTKQTKNQFYGKLFGSSPTFLDDEDNQPQLEPDFLSENNEFNFGDNIFETEHFKEMKRKTDLAVIDKIIGEARLKNATKLESKEYEPAANAIAETSDNIASKSISTIDPYNETSATNAEEHINDDSDETKEQLIQTGLIDDDEIKELPKVVIEVVAKSQEEPVEEVKNDDSLDSGSGQIDAETNNQTESEVEVADTALNETTAELPVENNDDTGEKQNINVPDVEPDQTLKPDDKTEQNSSDLPISNEGKIKPVPKVRKTAAAKKTTSTSKRRRKFDADIVGGFDF